ncbi:MAG: arylsulfatase A-like enzyme [Planctomycetota bacterium]|jgi:arylsulfatase A-like enzyme
MTSTIQSERSHTLLMRPVASILALCLFILASCESDSAPSGNLPKAEADWNLVILLLDALPANGVGAWGYPRDVTPQLDLLAASGIRFESAYAGASYTLAAVSSIFTGLSPATHRVVSLSSNVLDKQHSTLAEAFQSRGFATGAFSSNPHITIEGGFNQGFDEFRHYKRGRLDYHNIPEELEADSLAWWNAHAGERRFLYVHVLPPHQPYDAPEPHASLFGADQTDREIGFTKYLVDADKAGTVVAGSALARDIRARYDAGLHRADEFAGEFITTIKNSPGGSKTVFCILSDHGEAFAEHGRLLHGSTVFEEETHVPLILSWPRVKPAVVEEIVSTVNLAPTLCELFDLSFRGGESFLSATTEDYVAPPVLSRSVGTQPVWSMRTQNWSFQKQAGKNLRFLYDRRGDLGEQVDLLAGKENWQLRGGSEELTSEELHELANSLSKKMGKALVSHRELGSRFRQSRNDTHSQEIGDLGYSDDAEPERPAKKSKRKKK